MSTDDQARTIRDVLNQMKDDLETLVLRMNLEGFYPHGMTAQDALCKVSNLHGALSEHEYWEWDFDPARLRAQMLEIRDEQIEF